MADRARAPEQPAPTRAARPGWWRRRSVRARITVLATLAVAGFVVVAGLAGSWLVTFLLYRGTTDAARAQAETVAALVRSDQLPNPLPAVPGTAAVQVLDGSGRVLGSSAGGDRLTALVPAAQLAQLRDGAQLTVPATRLGGSVPVRVVGVTADSGSRAATVVVAVPVADVERTTRVLTGVTLVGAVAAVALFALLCWLVTGSAMRPVVAMRRGAARITAAGAGSRLALPIADDEVRALAVTLNGMLDRLAATSAAQRAFVADAAHELRSPLASLRVQLEVERDHPDPAARAELISDLLADLNRLDRLTAALLDLARLEAGDGGARMVAVDVAEAVAVVARSVPTGRVRVGLELPADPEAATRVTADPAALDSVLTNVVGNAIRHAASQVVVVVRPVDPRRMVRFTVSDDGPGLDAADRERVFDRFTRLDSARARDAGADAGGTGLGLAIVARVLRAHGATISLTDTSPPGASGTQPRGLTVTVDWPAAQAHPAPEPATGHAVAFEG